MKTSAVIVAAGSSTRMGKPISKQLIKINGTQVILHTLRAFQQAESISEIIVVCRKEDMPAIQKLAKDNNITKAVAFTQGGCTRQQSVKNGAALANGDYIAIHDGARPLITPHDINKVTADAERYGAAALGVFVKDTIKVVDENGFIQSTPDRSRLISIYTPQVFETSIYKQAIKKAEADGKDYTDDCQLVESLGERIYVTQGNATNIKLTTPEDITIAEGFLKRRLKMRIGHGYDVHKLAENRKLIIGGVDIPYEKGLLGHSDADVLTHAIMDALLGAAALGDIGKLFPDNDPAYKGADSIMLLRQVCRVLADKGYSIGNIDSTVIAQQPKLKPYIEQMRTAIANACGVEPERISVKATTEEQLGFTGSGEGISAHAVCIIE